MNISDWGDLRQFDDAGFNFNSNRGNDNEQKNGEKNNESQESQEDKLGAAADDQAYEITDWNDLRKFDDDHDDDWFKCQEKLMAEQYGGNFIKVKYSSNGRVAYFCELCLAECNAKKSLELHCAGMKHLKKKDMWEKEGKPQPPINLGSGENAVSGEHSKPPNRKRPLSPRGKGGRSRSGDPMQTYEFKGPPSSYRGSDYTREGPPSSYGYDKYYSGERYYDSRGERDREYDRFGPSGPGGYGPPHGPGGYGAPSPPRDDRCDSRGSRGSSGLPRYSPRRDRDPSPVTRRDYDHGRDKRYGDYEERRQSPLRPRYYGDRRSRSQERKRSPFSSRRNRTRSPHGSRSRRSSRSPGKAATPPSPPKISGTRSSDTAKKVNLSNSPAGSLLQKLAECCVKSSEDADLAINVVAALTKSLKEYCQRNEETKLAELLMEAELKVGTVKALKAGMKMLSNFTPDAGQASFTPGNVFPTYLGQPQLQPPNPPPTHYPSSSSRSYY